MFLTHSIVKGSSMNLITKIVTLASLLVGMSSANAAFINFNDHSLSKYSNQYKAGSTSVSNAGSTINLNGNLWMDLAYNSTITSTSILKFTFVATGLNAEIYGIAFDTNDSFSVNSMNHFALIGGEDVLAYPTANVFSDYKSGDGVVNFSINIGEYFTGAFNRIVFILDNDENWSGSVASFSNVEICDNILVCQTPSAVQASEPTNLAFAGLALMFLGALRRRLSK